MSRMGLGESAGLTPILVLFLSPHAYVSVPVDEEGSPPDMGIWGQISLPILSGLNELGSLCPPGCPCSITPRPLRISEPSLSAGTRLPISTELWANCIGTLNCLFVVVVPFPKASLSLKWLVLGGTERAADQRL